MLTATDEPVWDVDLLATKLSDKSLLRDAAYSGRPDRIAWRSPVAGTQPCLTALSQVSFWLPG
jgi:hypothetical protein